MNQRFLMGGGLISGSMAAIASFSASVRGTAPRFEPLPPIAPGATSAVELIAAPLSKRARRRARGRLAARR